MAKTQSKDKTPERVSAQPRLHQRADEIQAYGNAALDVRMHTMNMTDQEALYLMEKDAFQTQAEAEGKLQRAKLSSTQLPTYFVGNRDWWRLRKKYQAAKGPSFTLAEFHDRALDQGPIPLENLEKILLPAEARPQR